MSKRLITDLLNDFETVRIEERGHGDDQVTVLFLESPSNEDLISATIEIPTKVIGNYDLKWFGNK